MKEDRALSLAKANIENPILTLWVNLTVDFWLKDIQNETDEFKKQGLNQDDAMAAAILDSIFNEHVDLYFKITGNPLDENTTEKLCENMERIKTERKGSPENEGHNQTMQENNVHMERQMDALVHDTEAIKAEYEQKIQEIEREKTQLESLLSEAQEKIAGLQKNTVGSNQCYDPANLVEYDDTNISALPSVGSTDIISICSVLTDYSGQVWLNRIADLNHEGYFCGFHKNDDIPPYFGNRDRLFGNDCSFENGIYGIWTWSTIPNKKDPYKDYVISNYNDVLDVIEVLIFDNAHNLDSLVNLLKGGVEYKPCSRRVMFAYRKVKGEYLGILCGKNILTFSNGITSFAEDCNAIPVYEFTGADIVRLDDGFMFYRKVFAGIPKELYHLKKPLDIVKKIVCSSASWNACKARGLTRTEFKIIKDFLSAVPVDNIISQIESQCGCSNAAAKELLDEFVASAWKYVDGESLEDEIILSVVSANMDLQQKTKELIRIDWEKENKKMLDEAEEKLASIDAKLKNKAGKLAQMQETLDKTKSEDERLTGVIAEKEKLADEVETAVADRIKKARENAANFIANMAFVTGQQTQVTVTESPGAVIESAGSFYRVHPVSIDFDGIECHYSWADVINTAAFELSEAGVAEQHKYGLAAFLCAAYIEKQPIFIVGPNAIDIIEAFCASVTAHKYGVLCCEGNYTDQAVAEIGADGESIVVIKNFLASGWMNRLPEILSRKDIFYVATHPYAEDIQVEPKSLYEFMLPLFTEFFVDKKAKGKYYGGYFADDFKTCIPAKKPHKKLKALTRFALAPLVKNQIDGLAATMHEIYPAASVDDDFLFAVFPVVYASMETDKLAEVIADPQKGIVISPNLKRDLRYVLEGESNE